MTEQPGVIARHGGPGTLEVGEWDNAGTVRVRALREARRLGADCVGVPAATPLASLPQQWARELLTLALGR